MALKERLVMAKVFSKTSEECLRCKYFNDCDKKRLVMCAVKEVPPPMLERAAESVTM